MYRVDSVTFVCLCTAYGNAHNAKPPKCVSIKFISTKKSKHQRKYQQYIVVAVAAIAPAPAAVILKQCNARKSVSVTNQNCYENLLKRE